MLPPSGARAFLCSGCARDLFERDAFLFVCRGGAVRSGVRREPCAACPEWRRASSQLRSEVRSRDDARRQPRCEVGGGRRSAAGASPPSLLWTVRRRGLVFLAAGPVPRLGPESVTVACVEDFSAFESPFVRSSVEKHIRSLMLFGTRGPYLLRGSSLLYERAPLVAFTLRYSLQTSTIPSGVARRRRPVAYTRTTMQVHASCTSDHTPSTCAWSRLTQAPRGGVH